MSYDCGPITGIQSMTDGPSSLLASSRHRIAEGIKLPQIHPEGKAKENPAVIIYPDRSMACLNLTTLDEVPNRVIPLNIKINNIF